MALSLNGRADAVYDAVSGENTDFEKLSQSEKDRLKANLRTVYNSDDVYIKANMQVNPNTLAAISGIAVQVNVGTGSGSTIATGPLQGTGKVT